MKNIIIEMLLPHAKFKFVLFVLLTVSPSQLLIAQEALSGNHNLDSWIEDINYLRTELPDRHTDLYHHTSKHDFDSAFANLIRQLPDLNNYQRLIEVSRIMRLIGPGNGHSRVRYSGGILTKQLPFRGYKFKDGFHIVSTSPEYSHLLGAEIITVEGMAIDTALEKLGTFIPADNDWNRQFRASLFISLPEILYGVGISANHESIDLKIARDGQKSDVSVSSILLDDDFDWIDSWEDYHFIYTTNPTWHSILPEEENAPLYLENHDDWFRTTFLQDSKTLYARMNRTRDYGGGQISDFFNEIFKFLDSGEAEKLILDMRYNIGGNLMTTPPFINGIICRDRINQSDKFIVLTGRATYSAGQYLATRLDHETNATFIGEPTGGKPNLFADAPRFELPNTKIRLSASVLYFQVTWPWDNSMATFPQLYIPISYQQFIKGEDPVLEEAINYNRPPLPQQIESLHAKGGIDDVLTLAMDYDNSEEYEFVEGDLAFFNFGISLQEQGKYQDAIKIYEYYRPEYSEYVPLLQRLATSYSNLGKKEVSKEFYRAILKLDPEHEEANEAVNE